MTDLAQTIEAAVHHQTQGRLTEALQCYREAIALRPDQAVLYINMATALRKQGHPQQALDALQQALALNPQSPEAHYNLANLLKSLGSLEEAITHYQYAIRYKPDFANAYYNLANIYYAQGDLTQARELYQQTLQHQPDFPKALNHLGLILKQTGHTQEAWQCFKQAVTRDPHYAEAYNNLANACKDQGQIQKAICYYQKACNIRPSFVEAHNNCANLLSLYGLSDQALVEYEQVIRLQPDHVSAHYNRGLLLLQQGRFPEGWREFHWRLKVKTGPLHYPHTFSQPMWEGRSFPKQKVLVHGEQGLGDTIQFARYLPLVKARGGTLCFEVQHCLTDLFKNHASIDEVITYNPQQKTQVSFDYHISVLDLPMIFDTHLETIPCTIPYIYPDPDKADAWQARCYTRDLKVGMVWAGNPDHPDDKNRSCDLSHFGILTHIPHVQLVSLQKGERAQELKTIPAFKNTLDWAGTVCDFSDTAAAIAQLDLLVSVDTAVAHLAGALGKPVWILLPYSPDWRWMLGRLDSPWYPSAILFRQSRPRDWTSVIEQVAMRLHELVNSRQPRGRDIINNPYTGLCTQVLI